MPVEQVFEYWPGFRDRVVEERCLRLRNGVGKELGQEGRPVRTWEPQVGEDLQCGEGRCCES